jgi:hypothetical protein
MISGSRRIDGLPEPVEHIEHVFPKYLVANIGILDTNWGPFKGYCSILTRAYPVPVYKGRGSGYTYKRALLSTYPQAFEKLIRTVI